MRYFYVVKKDEVVWAAYHSLREVVYLNTHCHAINPNDLVIYRIANGQVTEVDPDEYSECETVEEITDLAPPYIIIGTSGYVSHITETQVVDLRHEWWDRKTPIYRVVDGRIVEVPRSEYTRMVTKGPRRWKVMP